MQGLPDGLTPRTAAGRAGLAALLARPAAALVALDFDGTLAPIVADPSRAYAHPDAVAVLRRLGARFSLAVVTGRPAATAIALGGFADVPGLDRLVVFGLYGAQRWDAATGTLTEHPPHPGIAGARRELPGVLASGARLASGLEVEDKGQALAVHTRNAARPAEALAWLADVLPALAGRHGLTAEAGRHVLELRPPAADKGGALTAYATELGAAAVLYAGDDLGDLAAFAAVAALRARGVAGVTVAVASTEAPGPAEGADLVVASPAELLALLAALAELAR